MSEEQEVCEFEHCERTRAVKNSCYGHYGRAIAKSFLMG